MVGRQGHSREDPIHTQQHIPVHLALPKPRSPYRMCSDTHIPPPPDTFPSITCFFAYPPTLTFHLIRDPLAEVFTHITLGHTGLSHLLTLHLWPLWNAMIHMFAPYFGFSQEHTSRNPCFPWEGWKIGDKSHLIISHLIISAGVTVFFLFFYMLAANLRLLVEVMRVDEVVHQLVDHWNNITSNDNLSLMLMDCIWSKSVLTIYNDYTMIILWNFIFYARLFCSMAFILIICNKTQARKKTLCRYVYCLQKWSHLQPSKWLHWFSADLCASLFYVHITCPNVDT